MPPQFLYDLSSFDLTRSIHTMEQIREVNPQRGDMEHLDGVIHLAQEGIVAYKDVKENEFWVPGHIPGRPLLPGVIMIEAAAQAASYYTVRIVGWTGFIGFGGVDKVKFRQQVPPGVRMYIMLKVVWKRHGRIACDAQAVVNGNLAFEGQIIGTQL